MKVTCRNCGAEIPAANINIQEMVALCDNCNNIFALDRKGLARKRKRMIPERPARVRLHSDDGDDYLELSYRMALSTGTRFGLMMALVGVVVLPLMIVGMLNEGAPGVVIGIMGAMWLAVHYGLAAIVTTTTRVTVDDEALEVAVGPLPLPVSDKKRLNTREISRVYADRAVEAFSSGMSTNNVYAEMIDGSRAPIVTSLPYEYAHYLAVLLNDYLNSGVSAPGDVALGDVLDTGAIADGESLIAAEADGELRNRADRSSG